MLKKLFPLFLLLLLFVPMKSSAEEYATLLEDGMEYRLFSGYDQFFEDFNKEIQSVQKNQGVVRLPENHAYYDISFSLKGKAAGLSSGKLITDVVVEYDLLAEEKLRIISYKELNGTSSCCGGSANSLLNPSFKYEIKFFGKVIHTYYFDIDIKRYKRNGVWYSRTQNQIPNIIDYHTDGIAYYIEVNKTKQSSHTPYFKFINGKNEQDQGVAIKRIGGDDRTISYSNELSPIKIDKPGLYKLEVKVDFRTGIGKMPFWALAARSYICRPFTEAPPTPSGNFTSEINGSCGGGVNLKVTIPAQDYNPYYEYYWSSTEACTKNTSMKAAVTHPVSNDGSAVVHGYFDQAGTGIVWTLRAYNPCTGDWSLCMQYNVPPGISTPSKPTIQPYGTALLCEGQTVTLQASGAAQEFSWYKIKQRTQNYTSYEFLGKGKTITVDFAGYVFVRASNMLNGKTCSVDSDIKEIKVVSYPQPNFVLNTERILTGSDLLAIPLNEYYTSNPDEYSKEWSFKIEWGDGAEDELVPQQHTLIWFMKRVFLIPVKHAYAVPGDYLVKFTITNNAGCSAVKELPIQVFEELCASVVPYSETYNFARNTFTGQYALLNSCYGTTALGCITGESHPEALSLAVKASAHTLSDQWNYPSDYLAEGNPTAANSFETGEKGKWRVNETFAYNTSLIPSSYTKDAGRFPIVYYNWQTDYSNTATRWITASTVQAYEPDGLPVQEANALNITSTAKFGYNKALAYLVAQNAGYGAVYFESFEKSYSKNGNLYLEENFKFNSTEVNLESTYSHSGSNSVQLQQALKQYSLPSFQTRQFDKRSISLKFWIRLSNYTAISTLENDLELSADGLISSSMQKRVVAQTGEWVLFEVQLRNIQADLSAESFTPRIHYKNIHQIWIDDIRLQPLDAQMATYVYDPNTLKLLATFDDQHFGMYYQYDEEGRLVRKLIETERGMKTLQENHVNVPTE
jgi:hypothetical protein